MGIHAFYTDDHYLSICEQVMREHGEIDQTIMHCIFVGPAGVGKSSLLKRLLRMKLDPSRISTQVAEKSVQIEVIRDVSTTVAEVSGLDWQIIEDPVTQASGLIGQLSTKHEKVSDPSTLVKPNEQVSEQTGQVSDQISGQVLGQVSKQESVPPEFSDDSQATNSSAFTSKSPDSETSQRSQFSKTIDFFQHVLKEKGVSELHQHIKPWTLYLTDSGGQPEFQELLPALVVGPCVFFVILPLDKDLNSKYKVEYVRPHEKKCMQYYISSLTVQEDFVRSLASIACTKYKDKDGNEVKPRVMLVTTFKDKVPLEEVRQRKLNELEKIVKATDAFRQGMIVEASETQMVFTINNASDEEAEKDAKKMRDAFQKIAGGFKVHTPSPWLIFSILVQHAFGKDSGIQHGYGKNSVISYSECFELAQECGIKSSTEFEAALQFLHKQTGLLHYYKEPSELSQIVIRDPQHLFSRVNELVERTFVFEETRSSKCTEDFKRGIFRRTDYEMLTQDSNCSKLNPSMLLKLLQHLHVAVPLYGGEKYFMPCAIAHLDEATANDHAQSTTFPPLLITFKSGYCPKGLFGALVACIANKQVANCTLSLDESQIKRDQICFQIGLYRLLLRINPTYIYIEIIPNKTDTSLSTHLCNLCNGVRKLIEDNIIEACKTLRYSDNANYGLSFICLCDPCSQEVKLHPAELRGDPVNGHFFMCTRSKEDVCINPECHVWLPEVSRQLYCVITSLYI